MKTMFAMNGFRAANPFTEAQAAAPALGLPRRLGGITQGERDRLLGIIKNGSAKIAAVRNWISTRINQDPMLYNTFRERYVADNFWSYDDLVNSDQWAVDTASQVLASSDPSVWNVSDEVMGRVEDWGAAVDIMYAGMQEYGNVGAKSTMPASVPGGAPVAPGLPGRPSSVLNTPAPGTGLSNNQLLIGGAVLVGAGLLVAAII